MRPQRFGFFIKYGAAKALTAGVIEVFPTIHKEEFHSISTDDGSWRGFASREQRGLILHGSEHGRSFILAALLLVQ